MTDQAEPREGIGWVERAITDKLGQAGPMDFMGLSEAIIVKRRTLGFALTRLRKSGAVVTKGTRERLTARGTVSYPVYAVADRTGATANPAQFQSPEAQSPTSESPAKPKRRGRKKGFVPGSENDFRSRAIPKFLSVYGALTRNDLHHFLGVPRAWLDRPLARLIEQKVIVKTQMVALARDGSPHDIDVYSLPGQWPIPAHAQTAYVAKGKAAPMAADDPVGFDLGVTGATGAATTEVGNCAACDSAGPGRGSCARCAESGAKPPTTQATTRARSRRATAPPGKVRPAASHFAAGIAATSGRGPGGGTPSPSPKDLDESQANKDSKER